MKPPTASFRKRGMFHLHDISIRVGLRPELFAELVMTIIIGHNYDH